MRCSSSADGAQRPSFDRDRLPADLADRAFASFDLVLGEAERFGLAVSGGSDSLALLFLAARWAELRGKTALIATVDHRLRPEAAGEARTVARIAADLGLRCETLVWTDPPERAGQALARAARHRLLARWARAEGASVVALGHTRNDRIETFLIRARAGSGWRGLAGPLPSASSPVSPEGRGLRLARPLLAFGRNELRAFLAGAGLTWSDDPSNLAVRFERVRMRRLVAAIGEDAQDRIIRVMDRLAALRAAVLAAARDALAAGAAGVAEGVEIDKGAFRTLEIATAERLLEAILASVVDLPRPPRSDRLARLVSAMRTAGGLGGGATLAGVKVIETPARFRLTAAPPRRAALAAHLDAGRRPGLDQAAALLADPRLAALFV